MDYEDLDSVFASRNAGREQSTRKSGYNEHNAASASFDVHGLKSQRTQQDVGARTSFSGQAIEGNPHSDGLSVVYARVDRRGLSSSSQQPEETNQLPYGQVDRSLGYGVRREGGSVYEDNQARALYSTVQPKSGEPIGYPPGYGLYDTGFGNTATNSNAYFEEHGFGNARREANVGRDGIYSFIRTESHDDGFNCAVNDAGLGRHHLKNDWGIYEFEQPVATPRSHENVYDVNSGYSEFQEPHGGYNDCGDFGYGSRPLDSSGDGNIYSFIRSDSAVSNENCRANPRGNGDAFRSSDVLQIALGNSLQDMSLAGAQCTRCQQGFSKDEEIVNSSGQIWHTKCFVCAQCFQQFPDGIFYEFEGRKYCEHDFNVLFAPCCGQCKEFIIGRVIKAMNCNWHPDCFVCQLCTAPLADAGFIKNAGRALCRECNTKEKARGTGKYVCHKCHSIIEEGMIKYKGEAYHPYHFNCTTCSVELNADAREKGGELYCLRCHDKMGIPICGACRRPIEERVVYALGKSYHVEHFVCAKCEKPFLGTRHYEKKGLAYCETHYHQLFGNICFVCNCVVAGDVFTALNKAWCVDHFACSVCDRKMSQKTKFFEVDLKPVCKACYEKFPAELKKRLKKAYDQQTKK